MSPRTFPRGRDRVAALNASSRRAARRARKRSRRAGIILVFFTLMMVVMIAFIALAVDYGYICATRAQLQRTADAAALAGASALYEPDGSLQSSWYCLAPDPIRARLEARRFIRANGAAAKSLDAHLNEGNDPLGDIVIGHLFYPPNRQEPLNTTFDPPNTVRVQVPLSANHYNGPVSLFFARVLGIDSAEVSASAAATTWPPALLPFATSVENWDTRLEGGAGDNYAWRPGEGSYGVVAGSDNVPEIVMFPGPWHEGDLPPGNFGLIEIGPLGSVLENVRRQIDMGPNGADMALHGGKLASGDVIQGRTGIKSATKHAFLGGWADGRDFGGMLGRPRMLPLYETATGNGENAVFKLAGFRAVHVMAVRIDSRWRTDRLDTEGEEITGILAQEIINPSHLVQVQLTR